MACLVHHLTVILVPFSQHWSNLWSHCTHVCTTATSGSNWGSSQLHSLWAPQYFCHGIVILEMVWPVAWAGWLKNNLGANKGVVNSGRIQKEGCMHIYPKFGSCDNIFLFYFKITFFVSRYSLPLFLIVWLLCLMLL